MGRGVAWQARLGVARCGTDRVDSVWHGKAGMAGHGAVGHGVTRLGKAGRAGHGVTWPDKAEGSDPIWT